MANGTETMREKREDVAHWVAKAKVGDDEAFCELVRAYQALIRSHIARFVMDSDAVFDLAQETFLAAYRRLNTFDEKLDFLPWLRGIARTTALAYLRKEGRRKRREATAFEETILTWREERLEADADWTEQYLADLKECMEKLQESSRQVLTMRYFEGRSVQDIAKALGQKEGAVRMILLRIRLNLKRCIEQASNAKDG